MIKKSKFVIGLREKIILMVLQIVLPFILYLSISTNNRPLGIAVGALLALCMLVLVVFG